MPQTNLLLIFSILLLGSFFHWVDPSRAQAALEPSLQLETFLDQVRSKNPAIQGSLQIATGANQRSTEAKLLFSPSFFAQFQLSRDSSLATSFFPRDKTVANSYSFGVSQTTSFGLTGRVSYSVNYTSLNGLSPQLAPLMPFTVYHDAKPSLELTQALWRNCLGAEVRATQEASQSAVMALSHSEGFKIKMLLAEAEITYWRLMMARETVHISRENLNRSMKLKDWAENRFQKQLADRADVLQAEAALQARKLDLQSALDEERAASRAFNSVRGDSHLEVTETLQDLDHATIASLKTPSRMQLREDVLAAEQQNRAAQASSRIGIEKNKPTFEIYGSVALNARDSALNSAISSSLTTQRPTLAIGARLMTRLDWNALKQQREAYRKEEAGAELQYQRKLFEQDRQWEDLNVRIQEARTRFELSKNLETIQKEKLLLERDRLSRGRSTTYQVLLFETDYALAQLGRIRAETDILRIHAQMKTFSITGG